MDVEYWKGDRIAWDKIWLMEHQGLICIKTEGDHAKYTRNDLRRPIIIQTHISPVPEFIVSQILKHLGFNKTTFHLYIKNHY